jgi:hypothetical protein
MGESDVRRFTFGYETVKLKGAEVNAAAADSHGGGRGDTLLAGEEAWKRRIKSCRLGIDTCRLGMNAW